MPGSALNAIGRVELDPSGERVVAVDDGAGIVLVGDPVPDLGSMPPDPGIGGAVASASAPVGGPAPTTAAIADPLGAGVGFAGMVALALASVAVTLVRRQRRNGC